MNNVRVSTHIDSLDTDTVHVAGLDVEGDLQRVMARGTQIKKHRMYTRLMSGVGAVAFISLFAVGMVYVFGGSDTSHRVALKKTKTVSTVEPPVSQPAPDPTLSPETVPVAQKPFGPQLIDWIDYNGGDASLCISPKFEIDGSSEIIGSTENVTKWDPRIGETLNISRPGEDDLVLVARSFGPEYSGYYVDFASGVRSGSYMMTSYSSSYCEAGLIVKTARDSSGYTVSTEQW